MRHLHKWGHWDDIEQGAHTFSGDSWRDVRVVYVYRQTRVCLRCNKRKTRSI